MLNKTTGQSSTYFDSKAFNGYIYTRFLRYFIQMKIKISNLPNGSYDYHFEGEIEEISVVEPYFGRFRTEAVLTKYDKQMILDTKTNINTKLICDRCAAEFEKEIESRYRMVYLFEQEIHNSEKERIEIVYLHPDTEKIDISNDVKDFAMLAIPMKILCREDCRGLCARCGKNLNEGECNCTKEETDPRWEPLLELKNKQKLN